MIHVNSLSGGRTSGYQAYLLEQKKINEGLEVYHVFMDTGAEHPKTYEFIRNMVKHWGINLTVIRVLINPILGKGNSFRIINLEAMGNDLNPWGKMLGKYGTPYLGGTFCTDRMKTGPYIKYCNNKYGAKNYITWLGIRVDEPDRLNIGKSKYFRYLAEISDFEKSDIKDWWAKQPFDLEIDEHLGNCVFCIKKSIGKIALAIKDEPEMYNKFNLLLKSENTRIVDSRGGNQLIMYRGKKTLENIHDEYLDIDKEELRNKLRLMKRNEGGCSSECNVFGNQLSLEFDDEQD